MQIAVTFADRAALLAHAQLGQRVMQVVVRPVNEKCHLGQRGIGVEVREENGQIAEHRALQIRRMGEFLVDRRLGRRVVKMRQSSRQIDELVVAHLAALEQCHQLLRGLELLHPNGIFDDLTAAASDAHAIRFPCDCHDIQVQIGRQSAVEPQLLCAQIAPPRQSRCIEEVQFDGLFDLIGK